MFTEKDIVELIPPVLLPNLIIQRNDQLPAPAATCLTKPSNLVIILYNKPAIEETLKEHPDVELKDIINHELLHGLYGHIWVDKKDYPDTDKLLSAADCQVNSRLPSLHKPSFVHPGLYNLPYGLTMPEYYELIPDQPAPPCMCSLSSDIKDLKEHLKAALPKGETLNKGEGRGDERGLNNTKVPKKTMRGVRASIDRYIGQDLEVLTHKAYSRRKPHKYKEDYPGKVRGNGPHILIAIDASGSTTGTQLEFYYNTVRRLIREYTSTVIEFTSDIEHIGKRPSLREWGGGTDFIPVQKYAATHNIDLVVWFTDGEAQWDINHDKYCYKNIIVLTDTSNKEQADALGRTIMVDGI